MKYLIFLFKFNTRFFLAVFIISLLAVLLEYIFIISVPILLESFLKSEQKFFSDFFSLRLQSLNSPALILLIFASIFFLKNIFLLLSQYIFLKYSYNFHNKISKQILLKYLNGKYVTFLESKKSDLIRNVRDNTEQARQVIQNILNITIEGLIFFSLCSVLIYKSSFSTIIVFILIIIFSLLYAYFSRNLSKKWSLIRQHFESYKIQSLNDSFIGFKEIKIFNKEEWFSQNYNEANINSNLYNFKYGILANIPRIYLELVGALSFFLVIFLNVPDFDRKSIINLIPLLSLYFFAFIRLLPSVNRILTCYESTRFMFPAVKFIYNDLNKNFFIEKVVSNHAFIFKNKIEIKNLSFSFPNGKEIFSNVNLDIKYREKIGIIGDSGIGKTTFVNILTGLIEPSKGLILCNGKNIHKNIRNWQKNIAYIGQKIFLINDTIENNISLGANKNPQHSKRIKESIKFANLNNFINDLPNGVNTIIDDNGSNLSGGQIQRIGIARAIYFNRELIICDEITSSLDFNLEQSIIKSLHELKKTIVIISHKKKNLELCSKIYEKKNKKLILVKTNLI